MPQFLSYRLQRPGLRSLVLFTLLAGCSKGDLDQLVDKAKTAATEGTEKMKQAVADTKGVIDRASAEVQEELQLAGSIRLVAGSPLKTDACYVDFTALEPPRAATFQMRSYHDEASESFPSVFLHSQVQAQSIAQLAEEGTIRCRLFVQMEPNGDILFSEFTKPVELAIKQLDDQTISAEIVSGTLTSANTGEELPVTGTFDGVWSPQS